MFHKEGYKIILITLVLAIAMSLAADYFIIGTKLDVKLNDVVKGGTSILASI